MEMSWIWVLVLGFAVGYAAGWMRPSRKEDFASSQIGLMYMEKEDDQFYFYDFETSAFLAQDKDENIARRLASTKLDKPLTIVIDTDTMKTDNESI